MHGSKKSLTEWLQVAALFSFTEGGISARSLQHIFHIATYQTAWNWLKKLRQAAAIAEAGPLTGPVYAITVQRQNNDTSDKYTSPIAYLIEEPELNQQKKRIRLSALSRKNPAALTDFIIQAVPTGQLLIAPTSVMAEMISLQNKYTLRTNDSTNREAEALIHELRTWMHHLYRGASSPKYIQDYLNEFVFRYNTRSWSNRLEILDHLFTGIMAGLPVEHAGRPAKA
jgi:hypothetical protein